MEGNFPARGRSEMSSRLLPPQAPCIEHDVASFAALVIHLRSQPELARENEKLLNAEALADLTEGVRQFQHAHLGRVSDYHVVFGWRPE